MKIKIHNILHDKETTLTLEFLLILILLYDDDDDILIFLLLLIFSLMQLNVS